jgi:hypothetical protein
MKKALKATVIVDITSRSIQKDYSPREKDWNDDEK